MYFFNEYIFTTRVEIVIDIFFFFVGKSSRRVILVENENYLQNLEVTSIAIILNCKRNCRLISPWLTDHIRIVTVFI